VHIALGAQRSRVIGLVLKEGTTPGAHRRINRTHRRLSGAAGNADHFVWRPGDRRSCVWCDVLVVVGCGVGGMFGPGAAQSQQD
jgi:hypothetical protein